jgi:hypothetical protein
MTTKNRIAKLEKALPAPVAEGVNPHVTDEEWNRSMDCLAAVLAAEAGVPEISRAELLEAIREVAHGNK